MWRIVRRAIGQVWRSIHGGGAVHRYAAPSPANGTAISGGDATTPGTSSSDLRLGHAFWSGPAVQDTDDVQRVLEIVAGNSVLAPRPPACVDAVSRAETLLCGGKRVIYAYSGCLHPKLGTIGLIISPDWERRALHGASRCDSGGLTGRYGAFAHVNPAEVETALISLSFAADDGWQGAFEDELTSSYSSARLMWRATSPGTPVGPTCGASASAGTQQPREARLTDGCGLGNCDWYPRRGPTSMRAWWCRRKRTSASRNSDAAAPTSRPPSASYTGP